ncbi:MAG: ribonuclease R family protein, partial [Candidatus Binatia bacterium]
AQETLVGALARSDGRTPRWLLVPLDDRLPVIEIIHAPGGAEPSEADLGLIALVRPTRPATATRPPGGTLEQILGAADDPQVQFLSIVYEYGLRLEFPPAVLAEAAALPDDPSPADYADRRDLRHLPFVTIDGESARDFDDAVCVADAPHGATRLWVAIADVAHYVRPGSAIDAEAVARGTSVYFPDRAIPMLPPQLSSGLCSLLPNRDRLVLVAELLLDGAGARHSVECYRAVIRSRARLTYTQVAALLSSTDTSEIRAWRSELAPLLPQLEHLLALMRVLHARRVRAGSLDLDLPEALVDLSDEGRSVGVRLLQRNDAHRLIEELMLAANVAVAEHLRGHGLPLPYRIHEPPVARDVDELNELLQPFGFTVDYEEAVRPADVQRLLDRLEGHRLARVLSRQILRALRQARYSTENAGHFGLAFPIYCHFTSPIRRYPDLLVHRQLGRLFDGATDAAQAAAAALAADSARNSQSERGAMEAERAMLDLKKCEFMLEHLLEPEAATVVTVISAGAFVELDAYPIEGLVRAESIPGDRWVFVDTERALKGLRTRQRLRLGDRVVVEAIDVSLQRRQIDFSIVRRLETPAPEGTRGKAKRKVARPSSPRSTRRAAARAK